ncbi:MAG: type II secretion system protein GspE [Chlamydiae bacterium RIFCSPHIGHO2_12_FULL_44_59]|nr:MAG: type II secretion system protein GspE [Chlamydiae bacterium RIFCSPHIGHO2_01_FULL_44_39]OGN57196.1 MAG: type II secretion system protein GspE [Chlamydiae bacterium RIFCSPHIGHO2_02_FULL_45_9]OGN61219.1 MAG: type II secretion system protein GspE [Chlamydiae bacterium RIFCSPHIGHO2_12_FULL_44_59]OGN65690.1 MAG: type II secretion system protein GspE [Chlamydiae bacterium RIFCSPLOWO2_01_FULL_44_52]OGN68167.1 MAG: type II secretion system protein GspE [Chlamydiae bacterium RIFCSPLOWO2_02_FULL_4
MQSFPLVQEQKAIIPYLFAKQKQLLPIEEKENSVTVAISDPLDIEGLEELRLFLKKTVCPVYCPLSIIESAIEKCYHQKESETKQLFRDLQKGVSETGKEDLESYDLLEQSEQNPVIRIVNAILLEGIQQGASDIHFEPKDEGLSVRYRIDGCLQNRHMPPQSFQVQILTRLKVMSKLDIAEHRLPQDGRIKLRHGGREIDFRVSTLPTVHGERIVLRILDKGNVLMGMEHIGMGTKMLQQFRKLIQMPEGIVLVTGPTGSGKTTTLYSGIAEMNNQETNILTIEDPVEYKIPGISQMNVNPKIQLDFAKGLRHILRQDPDRIMIGEIRDRETAEIAIQASLTGHLVLSTLHTNDAPSALTRLADMGIEPYLLASSILGVLAQRLVRQICPFCKREYAPSENELKELGLESHGSFFKGDSCSQCYSSGYRGRHAIYELMPISSKIKAQVLKSQDAGEIRKVAIKEGMKTLFEQGVQLVLRGVTTSAELLRVTKIDQGEM